MKRGIKMIGVVLIVTAASMVAMADWDVGDGSKMHYPQLPKVDGGWDVMSQYYVMVADDWQCSESGYVNDIHTWVSFKEDQLIDISTIHLAIWADDASGPYSKPAGTAALWHHDVNVEDLTMRLWDTGDQGWYDPRFPGDAIENDHTQVYQLNFLFDDEIAFEQVEGTVYWLEFGLQTPNELYTPGRFGWKQSATNFNDAAVWRDTFGTDWQMLTDPVGGTPMDMAFVITPEPSTMSMIALVSGCALFVRRRFLG